MVRGLSAVCVGLLALLALAALSSAAEAAPVASVAACPNHCQQHGECVSGVCMCHGGFSGADCSVACPNLCSGKGVCSSKGRCICQPGFGGVDCSEARQCPRSASDHPELECSGHGVCDRPTGQCVCKQGYVGADCSIDDGSCGAQHCSKHGSCSNGVCTCDLGFSGEHCEVAAVCPANCSGKGKCLSGQCQCYPGFSGAACDKQDTLPCPGRNGGCNGNGVCSQGKCVCSVGFSGESCAEAAAESQPFCAGGNTCSGRGTCRNNRCFCEPGFHGKRCQKKGCAPECGKHGYCTLGMCRCEPGWEGKDCKKRSKCPKNCSGKGVCEKGVCRCQPYYSGKDCSTLTLQPLKCPRGYPSGTAGKAKAKRLECAGQGVCFLGQCFCEPSFSGSDCSEVQQSCPANCGGSSKGTCRFGQCFCEAGWTGSDCLTRKDCPPGCSKRGVCIKGECKCALGYSGAACENKVSPTERQEALEKDLLGAVVSAATAKALRKAARAAAKSGAKPSAADSSPVAVVPARRSCGTSGKACSANGLCVGGSCACTAGWTGPQCDMVLHGSSSTACPGGCANGGECAFGKCVCLPGFTGADCSQAAFLPCPGDCSLHGLCHLGACLCHPGFDGPDCATVRACPKGCEHGACVQGVCECVFGWTGVSCSKQIPAAEMKGKDYVSTFGVDTCGTKGCGAHGVCVANQCVCVEGYTGTLCDSPLENFAPRVGSTPANPLVSDIFGTDSCSINCGLHGVCIGASCSCVDGWAGESCTVKVPEVSLHTVYGDADFLNVLALPKKPASRNSPVAIVPGSGAQKTGGVSLMESEASANPSSDETVQLQRTTAILSPQRKERQSAPDSAQGVGADSAVVATSQVATTNAQASEGSSSGGSSVPYTMSLNPWLLTSLCFLTGMLMTIALKCLLDNRDQKKRMKKQWDELVQPA